MLLVNVTALLLLYAVYLSAAPRFSDEAKTRYILEINTIPSTMNNNETTTRENDSETKLSSTREIRNLNIFELAENANHIGKGEESLTNTPTIEISELTNDESAQIVGIISVQDVQTTNENNIHSVSIASQSENQGSPKGDGPKSKASEIESDVVQHDIIIINVPDAESRDNFNGVPQLQTNVLSDTLSPQAIDLRPDYDTENESAITITLKSQNQNIPETSPTISITNVDENDADNLAVMESIEIEVSRENFNKVDQQAKAENAFNAAMLKQEATQDLTQNEEFIPGILSIEVEQDGDLIITKNTPLKDIQINGDTILENNNQEHTIAETNEPQQILSNENKNISLQSHDHGNNASHQVVYSNSQLLTDKIISSDKSTLNAMIEPNNVQGDTRENFNKVDQEPKAENAFDGAMLKQEETQDLTQNEKFIPGIVSIEVEQDGDLIITKNTPLKDIQINGDIILENNNQEHIIAETNEPQQILSSESNNILKSHDQGNDTSHQVVYSNSQLSTDKIITSDSSTLNAMIEPNNAKGDTTSTIIVSHEHGEPSQAGDIKVYITSDKNTDPQTIQKPEGTLVMQEHGTLNTVSANTEEKSIPAIQLIEENAQGPTITKLEPELHYITSITQPINEQAVQQMTSKQHDAESSTSQLQVIQNNEYSARTDLIEDGIPVVMEIRTDNINQGQQAQYLDSSVVQSMHSVDIKDRASTDAKNKDSVTSDHIHNIDIVKANIPVLLEHPSNDPNHPVQHMTSSVGDPQSVNNIVVDNVKSITITQHQDIPNADDTIELVETKLPTVVDLQSENMSLNQPIQHVTTFIDQPQSVANDASNNAQTLSIYQESDSSNSDHSDNIDIIQAEIPVFVEIQESKTAPDQLVQYVTTSVNQPVLVNDFVDDSVMNSVVVQEQDSSTSFQQIGNLELINTDIPVVVEVQPDDTVQDQVIQYVSTSATQPHINGLVNNDAEGTLVTISKDGHTEIVEPMNDEMPMIFELHPDKIVHDYIFQYVTQPDNEPEEIPELFVAKRNFIFNPDRFVLTTSQGKQIQVHKKYSTDDKTKVSNQDTPSTSKSIESNAQPTNNLNQNSVMTLTEIPDSNGASITIQNAEQHAPRQHRINSKYRRGPLWWVNTNSGFAPTGGDIAANGYVFSVDGGEASPNPSESFSERDDSAN